MTTTSSNAVNGANMTEPHIERFGPDVSIASLIEAMDRDGCAIVEDAIDAEEILGFARANNRGTSCVSPGPQIKCGRRAQVSNPACPLAASTRCSARALVCA